MPVLKISRKRAVAAGLALALIAALLLTSRTRRRSAEPVTPHAPPTAAAPSPGLFRPGEKLEYEFGWNGLSAATLNTSISVAADDAGEHLAFEYEVETAPALQRIWSFKAGGRTLVDPQTALPQLATSVSRTARREKRITVRFAPGLGTAEVKIWKTRDGETKLKELTVERGVDMPSAFMMMRAAAGGRDGANAMTVISGDDLYEVVMTPVGAERVEVAAGSFDATEYDLTIRELAEGGEPDEEKYRRVRVWVSRQERIPLKLESQVFIGHVYGELVRFEPGQDG